jgi:YVTN family beta-propeller protein
MTRRPSAILFLLTVWLYTASTLQEKTLSGTLIVLNKTDNTAFLIDRATGQVKATVATGTGPHEVVVSPDGKLAVVSNYGSGEPGNSLTVIDIPSGKELKDILLGSYHRPHGLFWLKSNSKLLVTAEAEKSLLVVNVDSGKIENAIRTGQDVSHMVVADGDGKRAYVLLTLRTTR